MTLHTYFGLGLKEMLADEMTSDMRAIRAAQLPTPKKKGQSVTRQLADQGCVIWLNYRQPRWQRRHYASQRREP